MSTNLSYVAYEADGVQTQYDLTFGYLSRSHVFVFVDGVLSSYRWVSGTRVQLNLAPDPGQTVKIQRLTDRVNRIVDFQDGTTLLSGDLNASDLQSFYILQEIADQVADGVLTGAIPVATASGSGTGGFVTEQWINEQLESNQYTTQAYLQLLQQITDEEIARAQAIAAEAAARAAAVAQEATDRATAITAEATQRAQDVLSLTQADLAAGQRLDALESTVDTPATGLSAKIATLETVTTDLENNKAEASVVTAIQSDLDDPTTGLKVRATSLEDRTTAVENGKADTSVTDLLDTEINDPTTGLKTRATSLENRATSLENGKADLSAVELLDGQVNDPTTGLDARATSLEQRTTAVENNKADGSVVTAIAQDLDTLEATVANPTTGLGSKASVTELNTAVAAEAGSRTTQINAANSRIDGVEADVTSVTQTQAADNQARIDDITNANAATAAAQADATSALTLVANEEASRISEVSRLDVAFSSAPSAQGIINENPYFRDDPIGSSGVPSKWLDPANVAANTLIVEHPDYPGLPCMEMTKPAGVGNQYARSTNKRCAGNETFKVRARVALVSSSDGGWGGSGVFLQARTDADNYINNPTAFSFGSSEDVLGNVNSSPTLGKEYVYEAEVTVPPAAGLVRVYATNNITSFPGYSTTAEYTIRWHEVSIERVSGLSSRVSQAQATADNNTQLISNETAARASALDSLEAQYRAELPRNNLIPGPYRVMEETDWVNDSKFVRRYNAGFLATGLQNPWTSTDAFKFQTTAADGRIAFTPNNASYFDRPSRIGVTLDASKTYALRVDVAIDVGATNYTMIARGNDDGAIYTVGSFTPTGGRQEVTSSWSPSVTQKYSFELRILSPSGVPNNWIYRLQLVEMFSGENHADIDWIDSDGDGFNLAQVNILKDALATGSSSQARLFMGVNTSNNEAFLEAYAGEGDGVWNGSKIKLKADFFEFDGTAVFNQGALSAAGTAVNFTVSGTAPSSPVDGEWWADSVGGSLYIRLGGAWQLISNISLDNAFRLTGAPVVNAEAPGSSSGSNAITGTPGIAAVNATGSVTYAWYRVGGDASIACSNTATANPTWSGVPGAVPSTKEAAWRCVATDTATGDTATFDVIVRLTNLF